MKRLAAVTAAFFALTASAQAYDATVKYTQYGIPHITGKNFGDLGFGYGYAFAKDNVCTMADQYVTVRAERSKYFGTDKAYVQRGNGTTVNNLDSDFFWQRIINDHVVEQLMARKPPLGPRDDIREGVKGYVAGWNKYLDDVGGPDGIKDPNCKGKPWVTKITELDAYRRFYQLILLASQAVAIDGIANAAPVTGTFQAPAANPLTMATELKEVFPKGGIGSNAVAIGRDGMQDHKRGLVLGNPHFPWLGTERFYQFQMTIPKKVNVSGSGLFGVPLALIGYTDGLAWSHTVSTAYRFTPIELTIDPTDNTRYLVDGQSEAMTPKKVTVDLGGGKTSTRTLWWTRYGPMFTSLLGVPLPWTNATAFAMKDANEDNFRAFNHFIATDQAQSTHELLGILKKYQGIPWVNTIAADKNGNALYADIGSIPNVSDDHARTCNTALGQALTAYIGLPVLDGSRSSCDWQNDADAVRPGIFGPSHEPYLFRSDFVTNSNDSYWLSNPHQPLEGFARIIGDQRTARSLRTRMGLYDVEAIIKDGGFTHKRMEQMEFSDRAMSGILAADDAVAMCRRYEPTGYAPSSNGPVAIGNACEALAGWDKREDSNSKGALLWRRFWARAAGAQGGPWLHPFDANDPVNTPNTLNTAHPTVNTALGDAITDLRNAHIAFDAPLGSVQYVTRGGERIPIHGGPHSDGVFNVITNSFVSGQDHLGEPVHGSSYIQIVTWDKRGCPDASTLITYSQSTDPTSPHFADQTRLFSDHSWNHPPFCADDVKKAAGDNVRLHD
ncbi:MAG: acyl-homoserine-lactone acylase [Thermoleophilaceae bacterium]|nr:acyl-homoserine-lactone acylase [Thermoleophilaceae bacterium]